VKKILALIWLAAAVIGIYAPTVRNGFVWDDTALILRDPFIRSWRLIPEGFQHFLFTDATASDFYRPIQRVTYTLDYALFGFEPAGYHLLSVAWHLAAAIALFFFASEFLKLLEVNGKACRFVPWLAAMLWAIHPVHTSAVAYVSGRADSLAAAFGFAGLYFALRAMRESGRQLWLLSFVTGAAFLLSALSKEAGLIFLAAWCAILLVQKNWRASRGAAVAISFTLAIYGSMRFPAEHVAPPVHPPAPALVRPIVVARAMAEYAGLLVLPRNLHMERNVESHPTGATPESMNASALRELQTLLGIILFAAFLYWLYRAARSDRAIFVALLLALITYLPVSGVYALNATVAEHWLYLPSAFLILAVTLFIATLLQSHPNPAPLLRPVTVTALVVWTLFLGGRTFVRTFDWKDQRTFLESTIAHGGDSARMLINLAGLEMNEGRLELARAHLQSALKKEPEQPLAVLSLASVAVKQNDFAAAHDWLKRAKDMPLVEAQAYELMAVLEHKESGHTNPMRLRLAARSGPPNWAIEKRYVRLLHEIGANDAAIAELRGCLAMQWYRADSWKLLGDLLAADGKAREAADALTQARRYDVRLSERTTSL
jgi:tetratricopeptide (TPR) repeat protein